jgi:hypothetical protein
VTMRMPTLLPIGEGCMSWEAIDTRTRSIRRGSGHGTSEKVVRVIGGDPSRARVAASTSREGGGHGGSRTGSYDRRSRVMLAEERALTSGALSKMARSW